MPARRRWPALTDIAKLRALVADVDRTGAAPVTHLASRFLAFTAQRPGMVRKLPWAEVEGVDWDDEDAPSPQALWRMAIAPHSPDGLGLSTPSRRTITMFSYFLRSFRVQSSPRAGATSSL